MIETGAYGFKRILIGMVAHLYLKNLPVEIVLQ